MEIKALVAEILSRRSGPFWQFVKYGVIGVASTAVQMAVFYVLAATVLSCLTADDWAVRLFGLPWVIASFFGGTSLLIIVGVALDTLRVMESHLLVRKYEGFLSHGTLRGRGGV